MSSAIREFVRTGEGSPRYMCGNWALTSDGNRALTSEGSILRYRSNVGQPVVLSDFDLGITGIKAIRIPTSDMIGLCKSFDSLRKNVVSGITYNKQIYQIYLFESCLKSIGAPAMWPQGCPIDEQIRIMRARMGIYAYRYVVYDDTGYMGFERLEDAVMDKLKRTAPGLGLFDTFPYRTGVFDIT